LFYKPRANISIAKSDGFALVGDNKTSRMQTRNLADIHLLEFLTELVLE